MFTSPEQFVAMHKNAVDTMQAVVLKSVEGYERLAELQVQAAKASMEESALQFKALFDAKDPKSFADLTVNAAQPAGDKFTAYAKHVYEIASETNNEIAKIVEKSFAENNRQLHAAIEALGKNAPAGSEGLVTLVKSAVTNANTAWDQVSKVTKQAVEMTEANIAAVARQSNAAATRGTATAAAAAKKTA